MKIQLKEITAHNEQACIALRVRAQQETFIAPNEKSLQTARENAQVARPFAIYAEEEMVGFAMFAWDEESDDAEEKYWLWRFMIDAAAQGRGYGRLALQEIIRYFKDNGADSITLSTKETNTHALALYRQFGFRENGEMNGEEIVLRLVL